MLLGRSHLLHYQFQRLSLHYTDSPQIQFLVRNPRIVNDCKKLIFCQGQHYYVTNPITGSGIDPKWDFTSQGADAGKSDAFVVAAKVNGASAPTGSQDIDWVQLGSLTGNLAKQVYRVQTRLGQPPASVSTVFIYGNSFDLTVLSSAPLVLKTFKSNTLPCTVS